MADLTLIRRGRWRSLTGGEADLCTEMFGAGLKHSRVRIFAQPLDWFDRAFVGGPGLVVWPWRTALADFAGPDIALADQATFVHEMTHVWQAQNGVNLLLGKLRAGDGHEAYAYDLLGVSDFHALNIEQQAMVVEHAFVASRGGATPHPPELYAEHARAWRQT